MKASDQNVRVYFGFLLRWQAAVFQGVRGRGVVFHTIAMHNQLIVVGNELAERGVRVIIAGGFDQDYTGKP